MNFCKDCRFIVVKPEGTHLEFARCSQPSCSIRRSSYFVDGIGEPVELLYCTTARISPCGENATLFEPKEEIPA